MTISRRQLLAISSTGLAASCLPAPMELRDGRSTEIGAALRDIEVDANGALGALFLDVTTGRSAGLNTFARFPHCSSFKTSLAALILKLDQEGTVDASEHMRWQESDLLSYSPYTRPRTNQGATLLELAEATQKTSDNTAANILLKRIGGPARLTAFWRSLGDEVSRLDRIEPELNLVPPGEIMDTTTPQAMAATLGKLLYGNVLDSRRRAMLKQWMLDTRTGAGRVRAGLPAQWRAGDKTGTGLAPNMGSVYVDIGFAEPPGANPIIFAAYFRAAHPHDRIEPRALAVLADVGKVIPQFASANPA